MRLRTRVAALCGVGALLLSVVLAVTTWELTRRNLLVERERSAVRAAYFDAVVVRQGLLDEEAEIVEVLRALDTGEVRRPLLRRDSTWYARSADAGLTDAVPAALLERVEGGAPAVQRVVVRDEPAVVVGVPLPRVEASYFEVVSLREAERTLARLATTLALVAAATTAAGALLGLWVGRRLLRPLADVASAAGRIAGGDLDARLAASRDPDLAPLAVGFNAMVDELSTRMQADRRFAADVGHELRSPLQTLVTASDVLTARAGQLDDRTRAAAELVAEEVTRFSALVQDLLVLARAGDVADRAPVDVAGLVTTTAAQAGLPAHVVDASGAPGSWPLDARRLERVLANLLQNAERHGGGAVRVAAAVRADRLVLEVEDAGPGVPPDERALVFERFGRGRSASARRDGAGTGLGLAIVRQHVEAHGGSVRVEDRDGGGARFVVELPGEGA